jgi:hypothetical protein
MATFGFFFILHSFGAGNKKAPLGASVSALRSLCQARVPAEALTGFVVFVVRLSMVIMVGGNYGAAGISSTGWPR